MCNYDNRAQGLWISRVPPETRDDRIEMSDAEEKASFLDMQKL